MFNFLKPAPDATVKVAPDKVAGTYRKRQLGVLLATCIGYIGYYVVRLIFTTEQTAIMNTYNLSLAQMGLILSTFGVGYGFSKLFMGALSDKSNPNRYLATGLILSSILNIFLGSTGDFYVMVALMLLIAITQGMGAAACQKLVQLWWGRKNRGTVYAIWSSAHNAGAFVCVAIVQLASFLFAGSLPAVFYTASFFSLLIAAFILLVGSDRPTSVGLPSISEYTGEEVITEGEVVTSETTDLSIIEIFKKYILTNKIVWAITLTSMSMYLIRFGIMSWIPTYLSSEKGFDPNQAKWLIGMFELAAVPGVIVLGAVSDMLKGRRALVSLISVIGLLGCLAVYFTTMSHAVIIVTLFVMGTLIYAPLTLVGLMVNEAVPKFAVGSSTGFMGFFQYMVGETLATALIGILVSIYGWQASNYVLFTAAIGAIALLIYLSMQERKILALEA